VSGTWLKESVPARSLEHESVSGFRPRLLLLSYAKYHLAETLSLRLAIHDATMEERIIP